MPLPRRLSRAAIGIAQAHPGDGASPRSGTTWPTPRQYPGAEPGMNELTQSEMSIFLCLQLGLVHGQYCWFLCVAGERAAPSYLPADWYPAQSESCMACAPQRPVGGSLLLQRLLRIPPSTHKARATPNSATGSAAGKETKLKAA